MAVTSWDGSSATEAQMAPEIMRERTFGRGGDRFAYEDLARSSAGAAGGLQEQASRELMSLLGNPTAHPAYQSSLAGVLASMRPQVEQGYSDLEDQFRQAGALQSGTYGTALGKFAGEVNRNETIAASDVLSKLLPTLVSGYQTPAMQGPSLLNAMKLGETMNSTVKDSRGAASLGALQDAGYGKYGSDGFNQLGLRNSGGGVPSAGGWNVRY